MNAVKIILGNVLQLGERADALSPDSPLLGSIPELDSMAVVNLIGTIEDHFGFAIDDDEISAESFATLQSLTDFVDRKMAA
jgi:acyl carrier protein